MAFSKSGVASLILLSLLASATAHSYIDEILKAHNNVRTKMGLKPLTWNFKLEAYAKNYAHKRQHGCELEHSEGPYGENLFWASPYGYYNYTDAVKIWVDEKKNYDYNSNSCKENEMCGHYTQVVWATTKSVGCAQVKCDNGDQFLGCNYDPPGNYIGEKPY
ncbi:hypothetical protein LUZ62_016930 [Rhynchospora pubera]|uniref:SCP domain-containing protein n=1 Tax=Rhynchospora pubera TaxID=906938 RepID=A0AAV8GN95_9POAL|nr:hypothetical protein LUZ62_016929 [Rhynchospora pubera]KAJ4804364.1 hypothetical protein LUZ62_016930 [Rhynchospora pubera]